MNKVKVFFLLIVILIPHLGVGSDVYIEKKNDQVKYYSIGAHGLSEIESKKDFLTPIGSLWKLFVYTYNRENNFQYEPYTCNGVSLDEIFCCEKGKNVNEDRALAKSCGLYFLPQRLRLDKYKWTMFWKSFDLSYPWLLNIYELKPQKKVYVSELLNIIDKIRSLPKASNKLDKTLLNVILAGTAKESFSHLGSMTRLKTFTWNHPLKKNEFIGGFAGWLVDGTIVFASGYGRSSELLSRIAPKLENHWKTKINISSRECVSVRFFHDYKIKKIIDLRNRSSVFSGSLKGLYEIHFVNGRVIRINSRGNLKVKRVRGDLFIDGELSMKEYIARVIDREADSKYKSASEAFSIVIRSYLLQRAKKISQCLHVIDSSKFQRVSASDATERSLQITQKTMGLILNNANDIRYHLSNDQKNMISWTKSKAMSIEGQNFEKILKRFFPDSNIVYRSKRYESDCTIIPKAYQWLKRKSKNWHRYLVQVPGYEKPRKYKVCKLNSGAPFANKMTNEIFVRGFTDFENQYSVAHEYLHLAFKHHPIGDDEIEIDKLAKKLVRMF